MSPYKSRRSNAPGLKIERISKLGELRRMLGYSQISQGRGKVFDEDLKRHIASFRSKEGVMGIDLMKWDDHFAGLKELATEFLDGKSKGALYWPEDTDASSTTRKPVYTKDHQQINRLLTQLCFKINEQRHKKNKTKSSSSDRSGGSVGSTSRHSPDPCGDDLRFQRGSSIDLPILLDSNEAGSDSSSRSKTQGDRPVSTTNRNEPSTPASNDTVGVNSTRVDNRRNIEDTHERSASIQSDNNTESCSSPSVPSDSRGTKRTIPNADITTERRAKAPRYSQTGQTGATDAGSEARPTRNQLSSPTRERTQRPSFASGGYFEPWDDSIGDGANVNEMPPETHRAPVAHMTPLLRSVERDLAAENVLFLDSSTNTGTMNTTEATSATYPGAQDHPGGSRIAPTTVGSARSVTRSVSEGTVRAEDTTVSAAPSTPEPTVSSSPRHGVQQRTPGSQQIHLAFTVRTSGNQEVFWKPTDGFRKMTLKQLIDDLPLPGDVPGLVLTLEAPYVMQYNATILRDDEPSFQSAKTTIHKRISSAWSEHKMLGKEDTLEVEIRIASSGQRETSTESDYAGMDEIPPY